MKTTLVIDDTIMEQLRVEAARRNETISSLVEAALRLFLARGEAPRKLKPLPVWRSGALPGVDIANRDELYRVMEEDDE